ncbi:efflux RND transporter permease subunit, partial [Micrococcus luteus]
MMNRLIEVAMKRTVLMLILLAIILVWGGTSAYRMHRDYLPPINNPTLMITVHAPSFLTEEIRNTVSRPIE